MSTTPDALLRYLADQDQEHGVPLADLPDRLLDAKLLTALDGLVEIGYSEPGATMHRGACTEVVRWNWRSPAAPGYRPLGTYLPEIVSAGWHVRLTDRGQVEAARLAVAPQDQGRTVEEVVVRDQDKPVSPAEPKVYLTSWREILDTLGLKHNEETRGKVAKLNRQHAGPIVTAKQGAQPAVERGKLLAWWNGLEDRFQELQQRRRDAQATVSDQHLYGEDGTVFPQIGGGEKKRRRDRK